MPATTHTAILSLGSNLGDRAGWLRKAAEAIDKIQDTQIIARSSIYETEPVDVPDVFSGLPFLNAVIIVETTLPANRFSNAIHRIEDELERTRNITNAPRTIDIDIITFGDTISDDPELTLPHPRAHQRRFVLEPLAEIAPELILPGQSAAISELLDGLPPKLSIRLNTSQW